MLARYYEAGVGRFLSADPGSDTSQDEPQSWNKYAYVRNNPIRRLDLTGKFGIDGGLVLEEFKSSGSKATPVLPEEVAMIGHAAPIVSKYANAVAVGAGLLSLVPGLQVLAPVAVVAKGVGTAADAVDVAVNQTTESVVSLGVGVVSGPVIEGLAGAVGVPPENWSISV